MESITKNRQSLATLRAMVARAYGPDQVPSGTTEWVHELGHGWFNVAYRLRLRDGYQAVLKVAPPAGVEVMTYERRAMATELAALALLAQTSVPVPRVDFADTSRDLVYADWFVMRYVDADNYGVIRSSLSPCEQEQLDVEVGAATRSLNALTGSAFGPLGGPGVPTWRQCFLGLLEDVLHDGERRAVDLDYAGIRARAKTHAHHLDEVTTPHFVEWDLWPSNVLIRDGRIVCLIDHERAFYGDPLIEAGFVATQLPAFGNPTAFLRGYGRPPLTEPERTRRRLYNLYLTTTMVVEAVYRGRTDPDRNAWARARYTEALAAL
ncbi:aminoglycoside phosphotransferase family protein [Actinoplanes sp. TRM 88003]|uniref:Aminoglycoside phosphotransferase family protein n=1 Tax=Paractinoplanes aksuensis TaxID=2939490 RepID=A0ABT1DVQ6_9ACTN|nr:aminoglycoside phosphotransferase family protein [Actinoplanes aksuensis]MCO8274944.1 aminoglycoside phosphotransferase family protein [Actinoplanes aksuensis]